MVTHITHKLFMTMFHSVCVCCVCAGVHGGSDGVVAIHGNIPAVLDGTTYESPYSNYDSMATAGPSHKETVAEFDNPLYSDTGPVTFSESTVYESVSKQSPLSLFPSPQFLSISHVSLCRLILGEKTHILHWNAPMSQPPYVITSVRQQHILL